MSLGDEILHDRDNCPMCVAGARDPSLVKALEPLPDRLTISEVYGPAMKITEAAEARAYFERLVHRQMTTFGRSREEAERIERANLGYYAGYHDDETRLRVESVFRCAHPIFGSVTRGTPTPDEAFKAGERLARTDTPLLAGGQGRSAEEVADNVRILLICAIAACGLVLAGLAWRVYVAVFS